MRGARNGLEFIDLQVDEDIRYRMIFFYRFFLSEFIRQIFVAILKPTIVYVYVTYSPRSFAEVHVYD